MLPARQHWDRREQVDWQGAQPGCPTRPQMCQQRRPSSSSEGASARDHAPRSCQLAPSRQQEPHELRRLWAEGLRELQGGELTWAVDRWTDGVRRPGASRRAVRIHSMAEPTMHGKGHPTPHGPPVARPVGRPAQSPAAQPSVRGMSADTTFREAPWSLPRPCQARAGCSQPAVL